MWMRYAVLLLLSLAAVAGGGKDLWTKEQRIKPEQLLRLVQSDHPPAIYMVGPRLLYNGAHVKGAIFAGAAETEQGLALLKERTSAIPKDRKIVLYCGCCPMEQCPNIRPAFRALHDDGFTAISIVDIPTNLHTDWTSKGYPVKKGGAEKEERSS